MLRLLAQTPGHTWFLVPTICYARHEDGEHMATLAWLNLEVGVRWR